MRIQRTSQIITVTVIGLSLLTIGCALRSLYLRNLQQQACETRLECPRRADQLAVGSDRLSATVKGYAVTGDGRYHNDCEQDLTVDRTRDKGHKPVRKLAPDGNLVLRRGIWNCVGRTTSILLSSRTTQIPEPPDARLGTAFDANPKNMPDSQAG